MARKQSLGLSRTAFWKKHKPAKAERIAKASKGKHGPLSDALHPQNRVSGSFEHGKKR